MQKSVFEPIDYKPTFLRKVIWFTGYIIILCAALTLLKNTLHDGIFFEPLFEDYHVKSWSESRLNSSENADSDNSNETNQAIALDNKFALINNENLSEINLKTIQLLRDLRLHNALRNYKAVASKDSVINSQLQFNNDTHNLPSTHLTPNIVNQASDKDIIKKRILKWEQEL